jgi:hypothetical protein
MKVSSQLYILATLYGRENFLSTHCIGARVSSLPVERFEDEKNLCPYQE